MNDGDTGPVTALLTNDLWGDRTVSDSTHLCRDDRKTLLRRESPLR